MRRLKHMLPVIGFLSVEAILFFTNHTAGTWLMGWDNLMPEFNVWESLQRNIFGVWLEYRGLGLFDGQSHAASAIHTLLTGLLSLFQSQELVRYAFTFGMHALGMIGIYYLVKEFLGQSRSKYFTATFAALFYGLNPATVQMFYTPFEPFAIHFAALPWMAYALDRYFKRKPDGWRTLPVIFLLSTPQFFVPTLLLPVTILMASFAVLHIRSSWKQVVMLVIGFFIINAFWLIPYVGGLTANAPVIADAKINQMSSADIYLRDRAFGDAKSVILLRGFPLAFEDFDRSGSPIFLMASWKTYLGLPLVQLVSWLFAVCAIAGITIAIARKNKRVTPLIISGGIAFLLLATDAPVAREFNALVRTIIPFLAEGLRVPFTKFILLFTLTYCIFIAVTIESVWESLRKRMLVQQGAVFAFCVGLGILALPLFLGDFISPLMRVRLPGDYREAFAYFQKESHGARVAILPQPAYWSWKLYDFGYHGSGFIWFGLPQAVLDRAFDPWSRANENYYWELSYALYSKNITLLTNVLNKYDISYVVLDEHVVSFGNNRALFTDETKALLARMQGVKQTAKFGEITVYKRTVAGSDFVSMRPNLPVTGPAYNWSDNDVAYGLLGDYAADGNPQVMFPYRSLFTKRSVSEREFDVNTILPVATPVYDSTKSADLNAANVRQCGLLKEGTAAADMVNGALQFRSLNQRGCLSFDIPNLSHKSGYLAGVESNHITGRPLMISFINDTARHVELETYLDAGEVSYFILPPLASDGLGYNVYVSNDSVGQSETINTISRIRIYEIPYNQMVSAHIGNADRATGTTNFTVSHPNPAFYKIVTKEPGTIILSQSFDQGWIAYDVAKHTLLHHVPIDNWKNGWVLPANNDPQSTIYILFWPQLLEFIGFALLPIPFILKP